MPVSTALEDSSEEDEAKKLVALCKARERVRRDALHQYYQQRPSGAVYREAGGRTSSLLGSQYNVMALVQEKMLAATNDGDEFL